MDFFRSVMSGALAGLLAATNGMSFFEGFVFILFVQLLFVPWEKALWPWRESNGE